MNRKNATGKCEGTSGKREGTFGKREGTFGKREGMSGKREGTFGKRDGASGKHEGASGKREGASGKREGAFGKREGTFGRREGTFEKREGTSGKREGTFEKREGMFEKREGTSEKRNGMFKKRKRTSEMRENTVCMQRDTGKKHIFSPCSVYDKCGGCQLLHLPYKKQLEQKRMLLEELLSGFCPVKGMLGMENPFHYRNKVHAVFGHDGKGNPLSGVYQEGTHRLVPVEKCMIENKKADEIIGSIRIMLRSFKIKTYDEDTDYGFLRHVLVKCGFATGEFMVVLVTASPIFPSKNNFVKALLKEHPEITTIIQNINNKSTSMVLGDKENVLYGKGYIEDELCGYRFRISSKSFYQVNPVQAKVLYEKALDLARLTGKETILDAYCGVGTIGIVASSRAAKVIGVELNQDAVKDAIQNARQNGVKNIQFYCNDAGRFMTAMAEQGEKVDVVLMDPPRSGSSKEFIEAVAAMGPERVVYISCGLDSLARDLRWFKDKGYRAMECWGVDMFAGTRHVETAVLLVRKG